MWFIAQKNIQTDRQNLNCLNGKEIKIARKWKGDFSKKEKEIYLYIWIGAFVQKLSLNNRIASTKIQEKISLKKYLRKLLWELVKTPL